ncbi:MAG: DUF5060 domain-containing protein [Phycisphaerales bacterium]|nr:MAG: DUF5060 domain-containing protein [Phycisphaerales bacterium]
MKLPARYLVAALIVAFVALPASAAAEISGELKTWHKITLTFEGPQTSEMATPNPFTDYRLTVIFSKDEKRYVVPGYYAADGNAAQTSADSGNKWRVHFAPCESGRWGYLVSFRAGRHIITDDDPQAGTSAGYMDGEMGALLVEPTDKQGRDNRAKGLLQYVGRRYLRFAGTGEYFLKAGADAPENFLAYQDFDGDFKTDGHKDQFIKTWEPHIRDWRPGDPTWQDGKGKGMIGAINYLASKGMNVFSFLPMNVTGDDQNVFPYTSYDERLRLDVSRLGQWEIVFEHADTLGMYLHFKTQETENELLLDGGDLGLQRILYYRELIARFGHHLALNWNLGEEINDATHEQKVAWANYLWTHDPYQHHIVIHNMGDPHYDLLGDASALTGFSLQTSKPDFSQVHRRVLDYINRSVAAGKPWVVACDEPGDATHALITDDEDPTRDNARKNALWGVFMAGGAGIEWYFGYEHPHSDLTCQDYRTRERMWDQSRYALEFFRRHEIPFWDMVNNDDLTNNPDDYCFVKRGELYLIYFKDAGRLKLAVQSGALAYGWFNPRTGDGLDALIEPGQTRGQKEVTLETPGPGDWLLCLKRMGNASVVLKDLTEIEAATATDAASGPYTLSALRDFANVSDSTFVPFYRDQSRKALAINAGRHKDKFAAAQATFQGDPGTYDVAITTVTETDGESTYRLSAAGKQVGTFTNPQTSQDYRPARHTWKKIALQKGDTIRVQFNTASNGKKKEGDGFGYARGRWRKLQLIPAGPGDMIFEEGSGIVAVEAEHFSSQRLAGKRRWYATTLDTTPNVRPDGDDSHAGDASGGAYLEVLPDTRRTHGDTLTGGENFSNEPGQMAVLAYWVHFRTPGRYYVWVRAHSTGSEDNGLHVGLDGRWPESGRRLQWCEGKNTWRWESKQRTEQDHCGEPYKIYLDIASAGLHQISFSMREDGFEFDKWLMTTDRDMGRPQDAGPSERIYRTGATPPLHIVSELGRPNL